jgi:hypothetical protein
MTQALTQARKALEAIVDTLDAEEMGEGPPASLHVAHWQKLHEDAQSALAAIDAAQGGAVPKVKALEWDDCSEEDGVGHVADTIIGRYIIEVDTLRATTWHLRLITLKFENEVHIDLAGGVDLDFAKAAAQAHFDSRILSALELPTGA